MAAWSRWIIATLVLAGLVAGACALGLYGCDEKAGADVARVKIAGHSYFLEVAATDEVRYKGLGDRKFIEDDGGMIFVFKGPMQLNFVMRDCPIGIDILFLDGSGRVLAQHEMNAEEPRKAGETDMAYNERLKQYPSRFPAQFAVELKDGSLKKLGTKEGDLLDFDVAGLKARAQ
jgi:uncharacterized membrane protein (UPF0127 family)